MNKILLRVSMVAAIVLLFAGLATPALAFETREGQEVVIEANEIVPDDLLVGAETLIVNGVIQGDLLFGGGTLIMNGHVQGDLVAGGQHIIVNGIVDDDTWIAGQVLEIGPTAELGDDLWVGGYGLETGAASVVKGSLSFAGYQALLRGDVEEDGLIGCAALALEGRFGGDVKLDVAENDSQFQFSPNAFMQGMPPMPTVPLGLTLGQGAKIEGDLEYVSIKPLDQIDRVVGGTAKQIVRATQEVEPRTVFASLFMHWIGSSLRRIWTLVVAALLLVGLLPGWMRKLTAKLETETGPCVGYGALAYFGFPIVMMIAVVLLILVAVVLGFLLLGGLSGPLVVIGLALLLILGIAFGLAGTFLTKVVVGYWLGTWIMGKLSSSGKEQPLLAALIGVVIVGIVMALPIFGWLVGFVITLFGLGTIWLWLRDLLNKADGTALSA